MENKFLYEQLAQSGYKKYTGIIGQSDAICDIIKLVEKVAPSQATILIQGENGTGKEVFASLIHKIGSRKDKPFIKLKNVIERAVVLTQGRIISQKDLPEKIIGNRVEYNHRIISK